MPSQQRISMTRVRKINHHNADDMKWVEQLHVDCRNKTKADKHFGYTVNLLYRLGAKNPHYQDYKDGKYLPHTIFGPRKEHATHADVYVIQYVKSFTRQTKFDDLHGVARNPDTDFSSLYALGNEECKTIVAKIHAGRMKWLNHLKMNAAANPGVATFGQMSVDPSCRIQPVSTSTNINDKFSEYDVKIGKLGTTVEQMQQQQLDFSAKPEQPRHVLKYELTSRDQKEMTFLHFLAQQGTWFIRNHEGKCFVTDETISGRPAFEGYPVASLVNENTNMFVSKLIGTGTWKLERTPGANFVFTPIIED